MAKATFFGLPDDQPRDDGDADVPGAALARAPPNAGTACIRQDLLEPFSFDQDYAFQDALQTRQELRQWAVLELEQPITSVQGALLIASHLDTDVNANSCRLAFYGRVAEMVDPADPEALGRIRIAKSKSKLGQVDRVQDAHTVIGKNLFSKSTDVNAFVGMTVHLGPFEGRIASSFGKAKFKVDFPGHDVDLKTFQEGIRGKQIELRYRKLIFDAKKRMIQ